MFTVQMIGYNSRTGQHEVFHTETHATEDAAVQRARHARNCGQNARVTGPNGEHVDTRTR